MILYILTLIIKDHNFEIKYTWAKTEAESRTNPASDISLLNNHVFYIYFMALPVGPKGPVFQAQKNQSKIAV